MTIKDYSWLDEHLEDYRKTCFLIKDNLDNPKVVDLMAMTNITTKDKLISHIEQQQRDMLEDLLKSLPKKSRDYSQDNTDEASKQTLIACALAWDEAIDEVRNLIKERLK